MKASLRSFGRDGVKIRIVIVFFLCMLNDDSWYENHSSTISSKSVFSVTSPEAKALLNTFLQCQWDVDILKRRATGLAKYVRYNGTRFRHSGVLGAQGSTMGKKKLDKIVRTYLRPRLHVSRGWISHFKHPRVSVVNRMATRTFREQETTTTKPSFSFDLKF